MSPTGHRKIGYYYHSSISAQYLRTHTGNQLAGRKESAGTPMRPSYRRHGVRVDILLGVDHADFMLATEYPVGGQSEPCAVKISLGWVVRSVNSQEKSRVSNPYITTRIQGRGSRNGAIRILRHGSLRDSTEGGNTSTRRPTALDII